MKRKKPLGFNSADNKTLIEKSNRDELDTDEAAHSKSARKREMTALQALGESLLTFEQNEIDALELNDTLTDAIITAKKIKAREGRRRQMQFIGKLMRKESAENIDKITAALDLRKQHHQLRTAAEHRAEAWRQKLLKVGDQAIQQFVSENPATDRAQLRQLVRTCKKEISTGSPPSHQRKLFRFIKEYIAK